MNIITLKPTGRMVQDQNANDDDPLGFLGFGVRLDPGYTLRSYFRMMETYPVLAKLNVFIPNYLEQVRKCPGTGCVDDGFEHLEFGKTVEMIGFPGKPRMEIYHSLQGVSGTAAGQLKSSSLEGLLDMPVTLGKLKHVVLGDPVDVFEFETVFSLFEYIDGIAWELSFHGTPEACEIRR
jgi:hypothetical protein